MRTEEVIWEVIWRTERSYMARGTKRPPGGNPAQGHWDWGIKKPPTRKGWGVLGGGVDLRR